MRRIAFINEKGGTGKTTLAVNVAAYLAKKRGLKTLIVDLDTQGHSGKSLGLDVRGISPNVFHFLTDPKVKLSDVTHPTAVEGLFAVPAYKEMSEFPLVIAADPKRALKLKDRLDAEAQGYDAVVFDAPPSMGLTTHNVLLASTEVVVPVALTYLALDGCAEIVETVQKVGAANGRPELAVSLVVPTLYRKTALAEEILAKLGEYFPGMLAPPVGFNVKIDEAQSHGQTIWEYAPKSKGAEILAGVAEQVWAIGEKRGQKVA
jgi:chromosome partitioning protein